MGKVICMVLSIHNHQEAQSYPKDYEHEGLDLNQMTIQNTKYGPARITNRQYRWMAYCPRSELPWNKAGLSFVK